MRHPTTTFTRRALLEAAAAAGFLAACAGSGASRRAPGAAQEALAPALAEAMRRHVADGVPAGLVAATSQRDDVRIGAFGVQDLDTGVPMAPDTIFRIMSMTKPITGAATLLLVEEGVLRLADPVERWLPELADRQVLRSIDGPIDDTVPAERPITVLDLLTFRAGYGAVMAPPGQYPIQRALEEAGLAIGPNLFPGTPDEYLAGLAELPLLHQPGERWHYHMGSDILGVLLERVTGKTLDVLFAERIFEPLGMVDTAFHVPAAKLDRLATVYLAPPDGGERRAVDRGADGPFAHPPAFRSGGAGLVSTAGDFLAFTRALLADREGAGRLLSAESVERMTRDHLTPEQKAASPFAPGFWETTGWGLGIGVVTAAAPPRRPGSWGWMGGFGTSFFVDPNESLIGILLTQEALTSPAPPPIVDDFQRRAFEATVGA